MPDAPTGRSLLTAFWPEAAAVGVGIVLLGPIHVPEVAATVLALAGYGAFRLINRTVQQSDLGFRPDIRRVNASIGPISAQSETRPVSSKLSRINGFDQSGNGRRPHSGCGP